MAPLRRKRSKINLLIPFAIIALVFGTILWNKHRTSRLVTIPPQVSPSTEKRSVILFFVADGSRLAREARKLDSCQSAEDCVKETLVELFNGPFGHLDEALPDGLLLNSVRIEGGVAFVDMNKTFAEAMLSGSSAEMTAVYSIVNTVCFNFPEITRVKLTVEYGNTPIMKHLDLSAPLLPDYTFEMIEIRTPAPAFKVNPLEEIPSEGKP